MIKRLLLSSLAILVLLSSGCLFSRKSRKEKESPRIATEVEKEFHRRWIAARVSELAATGVSGEAARQQAEQDYRAKFPFADPAK